MIDAIRELLRAERFGVLATLSAHREGWPFASVTAYALNEQGDPILLLSDLAEHTRNLSADPRASLLVSERLAANDDPQAAPRVTLMGTLEPVSEANREAARSAYSSRHAQAASYLEMVDFRLYEFRIAEARFIKGFGEMGWVNLQKETA